MLDTYMGELNCYQEVQAYLLFNAKMVDGSRKTVFIEPHRILEGDKSTNPRDRDLNRQARCKVLDTEWICLEARSSRGASVSSPPLDSEPPGVVLLTCT
ncbi:uncharacterized protein N7446_007884 [Penicillium canescens]|uniref:Uncharacterized protein n=1 Tax=Penicillium canescens TaxID=5083 RepID=A0AAD6IM77_PENCN|nr:uncharacterized protein N7446_007884 [Penicillium canescens]KAJ6033824.1 hypothetical protein N7444_011595 [Penicillium canescens]KAJ6056985.1 hypothetical protein N7460_000259 [Penicillium canescens]KAJ6058301.1 hypothetical protein N7446_007884 [Penicillium canescens]